MSFIFHKEKIIYKINNRYKYIHILGWCSSNSFYDLEFFGTLADNTVSIEAEFYDRPELQRNNSFCMGISLFLNIESLSLGTLNIKVKDESGIHDFLQLSERDLKAVADSSDFEWNVDSIQDLKGFYKINGWVYSLSQSKDSKYKIEVKDNTRNIEDCITKWRLTNSVCSIPLLTSRFVHSFSVTFSKGEYSSFELVIHHNSDESICIPFDGETFVGEIDRKSIFKNIKHITNVKNLNKAFKYLQRYGIKSLVSRLKDGYCESDSIDYLSWILKNEPSKTLLNYQKEIQFSYRPLFSFIYSDNVESFDTLYNSIVEQTYDNWEIIIYGKNHNTTHENVVSVSTFDKAIHQARGEYLFFIFDKVILSPSLLFRIMEKLNSKIDFKLVYTDEDIIDNEGNRSNPHFKPDFNFDLLLSCNYIGNCFLIKKSKFQEIKFSSEENELYVSFDILLHAIDLISAKEIGHISDVLVHYQKSEGEKNNDLWDEGKRYLQNYYYRHNLPYLSEKGDNYLTYRTQFKLLIRPKVSIIIPNSDHIDELNRCLSSIRKMTTYSNYECIIIENNSVKDSTFDYYKRIQRNDRIKVVFWDKPFNYSAINNFGTSVSEGDYYIFLNNDTEIITPEWIENLLIYSMRKDVGVVGAKMYYADNTIQHAGIIVGMRNIGTHAFLNKQRSDPCYFSRANLVQNYSAVTAACIMVKKDVYEEVKGFDESMPINFNDMDFCLRIRQHGYLVVYNPNVELYHYESKSRGKEDSVEKKKRYRHEVILFRKKWKNVIETGDPYYNNNLSINGETFTLSDEW